MEVDLKKLDEQIRKLEEIRRIASDPEMMALLGTVLVNGANGTRKPDPGSSQLHLHSDDAIDPLSKLKRGTQVYAIAQFARQQTGAFTSYELADRMTQGGHVFNGKTSPGVVVGQALRNILTKKNIVRLSKKGKGSDASAYVKV